MYIPEIIVGFILGSIVTSTVLIVAAVRDGRKKKKGR